MTTNSRLSISSTHNQLLKHIEECIALSNSMPDPTNSETRAMVKLRLHLKKKLKSYDHKRKQEYQNKKLGITPSPKKRNTNH